MPEKQERHKLAHKQSAGETRPADFCIVCKSNEDKWYFNTMVREGRWVNENSPIVSVRETSQCGETTREHVSLKSRLSNRDRS